MRTNKRFLGVMLDDATLAALKEKADQDGRTLSGMARLLLRKCIESPDFFLQSGVNASMRNRKPRAA